MELASTKVLQRQDGPEGGGRPETEVIEQHGDIALLVLSDSSPDLVNACARQIVRQRFDASLLTPDNKHKQVMGVKGSRASFSVLFRTNLWRTWLQESRERTGMAVRVVMNVLLGVVFGILYYRQIPHDTGRNTIGFLFALVTTLLIASSIQVCLHFPFDFSILMREYYAGANTAAPYFLGRTMSSIPASLLFLLMVRSDTCFHVA